MCFLNVWFVERTYHILKIFSNSRQRRCTGRILLQYLNELLHKPVPFAIDSVRRSRRNTGRNPAMALRRHFVLVFAEMKDETPKDLLLRKMAESTERCEGAPWCLAGPLESGALPSLVVLRGDPTDRCQPGASIVLAN